jgi:hypothetical protein
MTAFTDELDDRVALRVESHEAEGNALVVH